MTPPTFPDPAKPSAAALGKASTILQHAHDCAASFLRSYEQCTKARAKGAPTDEEQDLLRAMLVFACAGLDSMLKQISRDSLREICDRSDIARAAVHSHATKRLQHPDGEGGVKIDAKLLADLLLSTAPREALLDTISKDLTLNSLQSVDELMRVSAFFGVDPISIGPLVPRMKGVFKKRNQMIHEMDIDFSHPVRNRRSHKKQDIIDEVTHVFHFAQTVLKSVDATLHQG